MLGESTNPLSTRLVFEGTLCDDDMFCPSEAIGRSTMAVWLIRALEGDPPAVDASRFADVDDSGWQAPYIERLAELGVTAGCGQEPLRFCPDRSVTRAQMASFLTRAYDLDPARPVGFADIEGSTHEASINALAAAGISAGCGQDPLRFCPDRSVTRAQMATFLARALGVIETPQPTQPAPATTYKAVTAGRWHTCGLRTDNTITCWGWSPYGMTDAPAGTFKSVTAGRGHSCGLRTDNTITCWGSSYARDVPAGTFKTVSAGGYYHSCGLRTDGTVICWGENQSGQTDAPAGAFKAVSAGDSRSCGLRTDDTIVCWGYVYTDVPAGAFKAVSAGDSRSCGLRTDNTITCWGDNSFGQADAPAGTFKAVSTGLWHSCGLRTDDTIVCWGDNEYGQTDAPAGVFKAVSAGGIYAGGMNRTGFAVNRPGFPGAIQYPSRCWRLGGGRSGLDRRIAAGSYMVRVVVFAVGFGFPGSDVGAVGEHRLG